MSVISQSGVPRLGSACSDRPPPEPGPALVPAEEISDPYQMVIHVPEGPSGNASFCMSFVSNWTCPLEVLVFMFSTFHR